MFTENPRWAILGNVLEYGGGVGDVRRIDVVVDARRPEQPAVPSLVHCHPRLRQDISNSPAHAVVLDGAPHAIVSEGAVLQGDTATVGEQVRVRPPQPLRAAVAYAPPLGSRA